MEAQLDIFKITLPEGATCAVQTVKDTDNVTEYEFSFGWDQNIAAENGSFEVFWTAMCSGIMYKWDSRCAIARDLAPHWDDVFTSMISCNSPVSCYFDGAGQNSYCWALSECKKLMRLKNGIDDQLGNLTLQFSFGTRQYTNQFATSIVLRIDKRPVAMRQAVADVHSWWEKDWGLTPLQVPSTAKDPLYSFWYSYHKEVDEKTVEEKARWAKDLGFDICIVDDGWQADELVHGYFRCGDWVPAPSKITDMAAHVKRVQDMGMKYILWYAVPLMGHESDHFDHFKDMLLRDKPGLHAAILDPRYKEAREFMINTYKKALLEWNLDGFKLDFVDTWCDAPNNAPYNEKMDIPALQDAVDVCMTGIVEELLKIKPDILLEFRQSYVGPHMKRFGNMFRVGDCAGNYLRNRSAILDLRMMMGSQAVHSDMLMMCPYEKVENNAIQIVSCMFGVLQYSGRMEEMTKELAEMSVFWLDFLKNHKALLLEGKLEAYEPHLVYTWAKSTLGNECAVGVYAIDKCVKPDGVDTIYLANGCAGDRVLVELTGDYGVRVLDCRGHEVSNSQMALDGITALSVPSGGLAVLKK